eukprot:CAMPEP_0167747458 /NCGR_PEP_ID=MMETSP0110_2-20121227/4297_1 /TAXON_ID=629695 /ORGANISM="Gymnochlora sp., Strain CCMP2014" /LENGTH=244 /DNA_ID=CAMNT_0007632371 /DNA_START=215 /DNA_END=949 /DNA_ORIENTATION=-
MFWRNNKTIRPLKKHGKDNEKLSEYARDTYTRASLGTGTMKNAVVLPKGEDLNDWLAVNTVDFYNEVNLLYGSIEEFCTKKTCPVMCAAKTKYAWADGVKIVKPVECCAPKYVGYLMEWIEQQLNDESLFPLQVGGNYPKNYTDIVKSIFKRLFRVYAHIYHSHFKKIVSMGAEAHLNTCFKHFLYFVIEFKLVKDKELVPMKPLLTKWQIGKYFNKSKSKIEVKYKPEKKKSKEDKKQRERKR